MNELALVMGRIRMHLIHYWRHLCDLPVLADTLDRLVLSEADNIELRAEITEYRSALAQVCADNDIVIKYLWTIVGNANRKLKACTCEAGK